MSNFKANFKTMFKALVTIIILCPLFTFAHEGHHDAPGAIVPPKGGVVRSLETINLEMLQQDGLIKVFVYDKNLKPADAKNYPVSATATLPKKKSEVLALKTEKNHWEYKYDSKGSHRYTLQLKIEQGGHQDNIKWNIEPKHKH